MNNMNYSRADSEASVLTTECSRCVADDAADGLEYYRKHRSSPSGSQIGSAYAASAADETNWKDVVAAVKKSWAEVKEAGGGGGGGGSQRSPPVHNNRTPRHNEYLNRMTPPPERTIPPSAHPRQVIQPPPQPVRVSPERPKPRSPSVVSTGSIGHWDFSTPAVRKKVKTTQIQQPISTYNNVGHHVRQQVKAPLRSRSVPQKTTTDGSSLQRRVLHLQRTIQVLEDDNVNLHNQQQELSSENDRFKRAIHDRDTKLSKLKSVKQQINTLSSLNKKTSDLHTKRQRTLNYLDEDIKSLFTDWVETRHIKTKTTLPRYRKPHRSLWVC